MTPYMGQLMLCSFNFAPKGFALCNGQLMAVNQNQALFSLLGTYYGGNGQTTFGLPDLRGRTPLGVGTGYPLGTLSGTEGVTILATQIPAHTHAMSVSNQTNLSQPAPGGYTVGAFPTGGDTPYATSVNALMDPLAISNAGAGQPHENRAPFTVLNWIIALTGIYPSRP